MTIENIAIGVLTLFLHGDRVFWFIDAIAECSSVDSSEEMVGSTGVISVKVEANEDGGVGKIQRGTSKI